VCGWTEGAFSTSLRSSGANARKLAGGFGGFGGWSVILK